MKFELENLRLSPMIKNEIAKFEALQRRFESVGALDSDSEAVFQMLIAVAINGDPVDLDMPIDWDLYEPDDEAGEADGVDPSALNEANLEMNAQAWQVYRAIQSTANVEDQKELKRYCSRIDREEFEPQRG
ncbi:hypothetical protein BH10BDE1_BH10BDE1_15460 [soil metagenome]